MVTTVRRRAVALFVLLALLAGLTVWYGTLVSAPEHGDYPDDEQLTTAYEHYHGEHVTVGGRVVATDPVTIVVGTDTGTPLRLTVTDVSIGVAEGDELRVYGVVESDHKIRATNAVAVPQAGHWYAYSVSFLAGVWVLARLFRYWRLDFRTWMFSPRRVPLAPLVVGWLRTRLGRDTDA
jgi:hypothetical protein